LTICIALAAGWPSRSRSTPSSREQPGDCEQRYQSARALVGDDVVDPAEVVSRSGKPFFSLRLLQLLIGDRVRDRAREASRQHRRDDRAGAVHEPSSKSAAVPRPEAITGDLDRLAEDVASAGPRGRLDVEPPLVRATSYDARMIRALVLGGWIAVIMMMRADTARA
jgi:hypothetical protein